MFRELDYLMLSILNDQPNISVSNKRADIISTDIVFLHPSKLKDVDVGTGKVNIFLYDIRENTDLYKCDTVDLYNETTKKLIQLPPPLRITCSYLVTAWLNDNNEQKIEEHHLLSQVAEVFLRHKNISRQDVINGIQRWWQPAVIPAIADDNYPLPVFDINWNSQQKPFEFWPALGASMRPSLTITATVSIPVEDRSAYQPMPPVTEIIVSNIIDEDGIEVVTVNEFT